MNEVPGPRCRDRPGLAVPGPQIPHKDVVFAIAFGFRPGPGPGDAVQCGSVTQIPAAH